MADVIAEWAGQERHFRLVYGSVLDLEQATGAGIGHVFIRVSGGQFMLNDVYHTLRLGLIGAGISVLDAKRLMDTHFDNRPGGYMENASLAAQILAALMVGVEPANTDGDTDVPAPHKFSELVQMCRVFHMSPADLRAMPYADFVNMVRGYNAGSAQNVEHLTEDEFIDILNRYEPEAGT